MQCLPRYLAGVERRKLTVIDAFQWKIACIHSFGNASTEAKQSRLPQGVGKSLAQGLALRRQLEAGGSF